MNSFEKRHFIRVRVDFPLSIEVGHGNRNMWVATALNISIDGMQLQSDTEMALDTTILLHFPADWSQACVIAKVIRRDGSEYGCQFLDLSPIVRKTLDEAIYQHWRNLVHKALPGL